MSKQQKEETSVTELDKALTEIDVLADEERNIFRVDAETFRFQNIEFKLIEDYKEAFDIEMMEERFTDYLLKYDYIVGDIAYEKLRLRGFFEDNRKGVPIDMKISNLEDYLVEYCNFGSQYFVFERVEKKKEDPESYFKRNKKSNRNRRRNNSKRKNQSTQNRKRKRNQNQNKQKQQNQRQNQNKKQQDKRQTKQNDFKVQKKEVEQTNKSQENKTKLKQQPKAKKIEDKKQFKIRKKND